jgi:hypothetical protein
MTTDWLQQAVAQVSADPARLASLFPAVGRRTGREPLHADDPQGLVAGTVDDAGRARLLSALRLPPDELAEQVRALYRHGDAAEKRGVLRALHLLDGPVDGIGDRCLDLVSDGLRSNDVRLVAAALGPYGAQHLDDAAYRQAVVKCLFVGVPLAAVHGLDARADAELAGMAARLVQERVAAGRDVPADVWRLLDVHPAALEETGVLAELDSPVAERRDAARRLLAGRPTAAAAPPPAATHAEPTREPS